MAFNPDLYLARKKGVGFKDPNVEREYTSLDDDTKRLALNSPAPVTITSGRRSLEENNLVGGVPNSKHLSGEAFDVRKTVAPEALNYFKDNGYQVLNEGDHFHVEKNNVVDKPKEPVKMAFDPDKYLSKKRALIQGQTISSKPPIEQEKDSLAPIKTGFRDFTKAATFGLSEPIQAGLSTAAIESIKGEKGIGQSIGDAALSAINPALPFVRAVQRNPNLYKSIRDKNAASLQQLEKENPKAALIGELAGYVAPATATSKVYGATGKLAEKVVPNIGSSLLRRAGTGIGKAVVRGGGAGAIGGAIDPEQDVLSGAAGGAIGDVIGSGVGKALGAASSGLNKRASRTLNRMLGVPKKDLKRGENIGEELVERGIVESPEKLSERARQEILSKDAELDALLDKASSVEVDKAATATNKINPNTVLDELSNLRRRFENTPNSTAEIKAIDEAISGLKERSDKFLDVTPKQANEIKRSLYKNKLNDAAYYKDSLPVKKDIDKATARGYRKATEEKVPEAAGINKELSFNIRLAKAANDALAKAEQGGSNSPYFKMWRVLRDVGLLTGGVATGNPLAGLAAVGLTEGLGTATGQAMKAKTYRTLSKKLSSANNFPFSRTGAAMGYKSIKKKQEEQRQ